MSATMFFKFTLFSLVVVVINGDYWSDRASFINKEFSRALGSTITLTPREQKVNQILMAHKLKEYDDGFNNPEKFLPNIHFFNSKHLIEQSEVFKFIQKLPKGASLHSHDTAMVSPEYLFNLTYEEKLYGCVVDGRLRLKFFDPPNDFSCVWKLLRESRAEDPNFDVFLHSQISLIVPDPKTAYLSIGEVWAKFMEIFETAGGLICYKPIFQRYFYQALKELHDDNVMYLEFRGLLPEVYDLDGTRSAPEEVVGLYVETLAQFKRDHPRFQGARLIYAPSRAVDNATCDDYVTTVKSLKAKFPDFIAGFDLVGEEDRGNPLSDFVPQMLDLSESGIKLFFHAAETNWYGTPTDFNLIDAILLNTTRLGHAYGAVKHPQILQEIQNRQIAIEISPISNQVLMLVDDLRNHPGASLIAGGYPVVISCDDPTFWGARGLSYDWYSAFMAFGSRESDLRLLKQLAVNSLKYSSLDGAEVNAALEEWSKEWDEFLSGVIEEEYRVYYVVNRV